MRNGAAPFIGFAATLLLLSACQDGTQSPRERPGQPLEEDRRSDDRLRPIDLVYVCGNKFLATNATGTAVQVEFRVLGSSESGWMMLADGSDEHAGYSETELETTGGGTVELYRDGERIAQRRNEGQPCGPQPTSASIASLSDAESGRWSGSFPWNGVATHLSLLSTGKVLSWGETVDPQVWDPSTGTFKAVPSPALLFCAGHAFLADGRLLVVGGHISTSHGLPDITLFDPISESWSRSAPMRRGRWYPTVTTLASGDGLILFGTDESGVRVDEPEIWSGGGLRSLPTTTWGPAYYPRNFLAPNGRLVNVGETQRTRYLDYAGTGKWKPVGDRLYGKRDYGAAVMYDVGKILYVGGGRTTNTAEIIDLNSAAPAWQWTGSMVYPRRHLNATVLPTGEVLVTGGSSGTAFNDLTKAVHATELWSPTTGTWTMLASSAVNRAYHSTSILLPDGRVLHAGSGDTDNAPDEMNAELFSPPYLFKGPRPTLSAAPSRVGYGTSFRVTTPDASSITKVSLIRPGSATHAFDMNQRFQWLSFSRQSGALTITAPTSRNVTPPGHYMLFILNGDGVPSMAKIVRIGVESDPDPPFNAPPTASFSSTCTGLTCAFTDGSADTDGNVVGWSWDFGDGLGSTARHPSYTYAAEGTYEVTLTATDDGGATGTETKTITVTVSSAPAAPVASFTWACNGLDCNFTDSSTDDGSVTTWSWDFGDNTALSSNPNPSHTYAQEGSYTVTLTVTDDAEMTGTATHTASVTAPSSNTGPTPAFTWSCSGLSCGFTDGSTDADGSVVGWSWDFGDGGTSSLRNPSHTYAAAGSYAVVLTAGDDDQATASVTHSVTVSAPSSIVLSVRGWTDATKQYMALTWTGAVGSTVDVYRDGVFLRNELNDGKYTNSRNLPGASQYTYKVCQAGTTICSNEATVTFGTQPPPPSIVLSVTGWVDATKQYMALTWTGAVGTTVDVYRNASFLVNELNDGRYTNSRNLPGASQYTYKICEAGTTTCSNDATVIF